MTTISIIIPTYNRLHRLRQVVAGLARQTYPLDDVEIIIVSDGSTDGTDEYLHALSVPLHIIPVIQPNSGPSVARNTGIAHATGDIVVFLDDDVVPTPRWLAEHMRMHAQQPDAVVLGPMISPLGFAMQPWVRWEQAMLMKQYTHMAEGVWKPSARQFYTGNTSLARRHLLYTGGFDESLRRAEDVELAYRLAEHKIEFVFNSAAIGLHYAERSFDSWMRTPYAYGRSDVIFGRDKGHEWLLPELRHEFQKRNPLVQLLTQVCIDRAALQRGVVAGLQAVATNTERLGYEQLTSHAYSALFNLRYYQGLADEIGGWQRFIGTEDTAQTQTKITREHMAFDSHESCGAHLVEL
ncbi:MAG TPA: exopolysaccharide biosynthesis glycosyltransferase EpsD [Roseiflexaceae bacterium]|nr:exopolysaccharide biosynthesis glycosyltransferase EpsD [Roseiflexaceae bacterium]